MGQSDASPSFQGSAFQRASGSVDLVISDGGLQRYFQSGSAKLFLPKTYAPTIEAVLVNTAGGFADGDKFDYRVTALGRTNLTVTTQTAERVYRAAGASPATLNIKIIIDAEATCHWLPQETIFFDGAQFDRNLTVSMDSTSSFLSNEIMVFGRAAMQETVTSGFLKDQWRIWRAGRLVHAESVRLDGVISKTLSVAASAGDNVCLATCLLVAPNAETKLQIAHDFFAKRVDVQAGISAWNGKLVVRCLAKESVQAKKAMSGFLSCLRGLALPRVWNQSEGNQ